MSKFSIIAKSILITMGMIGLACANTGFSDYSSLNRWTGFYAGIDVGLTFNKLRLRSQQLGFTSLGQVCNTNSDYSTFFPGIQLGYMHQFPNAYVSGIETNVTFNADQYHTLGCTCPINPSVSDRFSFRNQIQSSIKGRGGRVVNWNNNILLPYLTAGASFANAGLSYKNEGEDYYSKNSTQTGLLIGTGIEWAFTQNWSFRVEYTYVDYGNIIKLRIPSVYGLLDLKGNARVGLNSNNILIAINYWI